MKKKAMADSVIFNRLLDGKLSFVLLQGYDLFVTPMQYAELQATPDSSRRADLMAVFAQGAPQEHDIETAVWGVTPWGERPFGGTASLLEPIFTAMQARRKRKSNHADDVIAEAAILNSCVLLSDDQDLLAVVPQFGGQVMNPLSAQHLTAP